MDSLQILLTGLSSILTVLLFGAGLVAKSHANKQNQLAEAHTDRLKELEIENKEQAKAQHSIDLRLTGAEASLHATKNNIMGIKDELSEIRSQMVRREDLHTGMETIMQRIDAVAPRRK